MRNWKELVRIPYRFNTTIKINTRISRRRAENVACTNETSQRATMNDKERC